MDEFVCVTLLSRPGESEAGFKSRLVEFWSDYLRTQLDDYERVYAEATRFEPTATGVGRQYLVDPDGIDTLEAMLKKHAIDCEPIDRDDLYSKYEAAPPNWFQLSH